MEMNRCRRRHTMPFGATLLDEQLCRFRLWAPAVQRVDLCLGEHQLPMERGDEGWFMIETTAPAGSAYRYRIDGGLQVPDPAARAQAEDVHGPSLVVDPHGWLWSDEGWRGRPWEETVVYELHVGTFTPQGTFSAIIERLDYLKELGITALELMPVSDFPGRRNWGYDGVLPFAPDRRYGTPDDLKALVEAAHARDLMVFLDVVYNHFGPEGNYLNEYAPNFFTDRHHTPWGSAINFDGANAFWVREFFIENALYWLEEFHLDGLRLDAVHAIDDDSEPDILQELASRVRARFTDRHVHLVLENDRNESRYLERGGKRPRGFDAQWNDDAHHAFHVLCTGEDTGYYIDYAARTPFHLGRCLAEGFAYQGERSTYRNGAARGESSTHLAATSFVNFLQNHDQVGNRARGERIDALADTEAIRAVTAILLLAPSPPLLFMGQEWGSRNPFLFFCDFGPELAHAVTEGRRREFSRFPQFSDPAARASIPDPAAADTYTQSRLDWATAVTEQGQSRVALVRQLLALRREQIIPRLRDLPRRKAAFTVFGKQGLQVQWRLGDGTHLILIANLGTRPLSAASPLSGQLLWTTHPGRSADRDGELPGWSVGWFLDISAGEA